ncbi:hypothetical protein HDU96_006056 [Phlyctochytrium bullatum]|nr:hypothetical protein HDU96_006056 [Phlyctochytrium bullatum]
MADPPTTTLLDLPSELLLLAIVYIHPHRIRPLRALCKSFDRILSQPLGLAFAAMNLSLAALPWMQSSSPTGSSFPSLEVLASRWKPCGPECVAPENAPTDGSFSHNPWHTSHGQWTSKPCECKRLHLPETPDRGDMPSFLPESSALFSFLSSLRWDRLGLEYTSALFVLVGFTHQSLKLVDPDFVSIVHRSVLDGAAATPQPFATPNSSAATSPTSTPPHRTHVTHRIAAALIKALRWCRRWADAGRCRFWKRSLALLTPQDSGLAFRVLGAITLDLAADDYFCLRWLATADQVPCLQHLLSFAYHHARPRCSIGPPYHRLPLATRLLPAHKTAVTEAFLLAVYDDSPGVVRYLLDAGLVRLDELDGEAHLRAAQSGSIAVLKVLLEFHQRQVMASVESQDVDAEAGWPDASRATSSFFATSSLEDLEGASPTPTPPFVSAASSRRSSIDDEKTYRPAVDPSSPQGIQVLQAAARSAHLYEEQIELLQLVAKLAGWEAVPDPPPTAEQDEEDDDETLTPGEVALDGDEVGGEACGCGAGRGGSHRCWGSQPTPTEPIAIPAPFTAFPPTEPQPPPDRHDSDDRLHNMAQVLIEEAAYANNAGTVEFILDMFSERWRRRGGHVAAGPARHHTGPASRSAMPHPLAAANDNAPIKIAAACGHLDVCRVLVRRGGVDPAEGVVEAVEEGRWEVVWYLVGVEAARKAAARSRRRVGRLASVVRPHEPPPHHVVVASSTKTGTEMVTARAASRSVLRALANLLLPPARRWAGAPPTFRMSMLAWWMVWGVARVGKRVMAFAARSRVGAVFAHREGMEGGEGEGVVEVRGSVKRESWFGWFVGRTRGKV